MDLGSPLLDVVPSVRGTLLQVLARLEQPVTRRQLAAAAGVAPGHASSVVQALIDAGLVSETSAGRSSMVSLNREHLAAAPVIALAGLRGALIRRLRERLTGTPGVREGWLFGSVGRGDADGSSDIDVLLIVDDVHAVDLQHALSQLHADVRIWTGNDLQLVEHSPSSWKQLTRAKNPLVDEIRRDGILLAGDGSMLGRRV